MASMTRRTRNAPRKPEWLEVDAASARSFSPRKSKVADSEPPLSSVDAVVASSMRSSRRRAPRGYDIDKIVSSPSSREYSTATRSKPYPVSPAASTSSSTSSKELLPRYDKITRHFNQYDPGSGWQPKSLAMRKYEASRKTNKPNSVVQDALQDAKLSLKLDLSHDDQTQERLSALLSSQHVYGFSDASSPIHTTVRSDSPRSAPAERRSATMDEQMTQQQHSFESQYLIVDRAAKPVTTKPNLDALRTEVKDAFRVVDEMKDIHRVLFNFDKAEDYDPIVEARAIQMAETAFGALEQARERYKAYVKTRHEGGATETAVEGIAQQVMEEETHRISDKIDKIDTEANRTEAKHLRNDKKQQQQQQKQQQQHLVQAMPETAELSRPSDHSDLFHDFDAKMSQIRRSLRTIAEQDGVIFRDTMPSTLDLSSGSYLHAFRAQSEKMFDNAPSPAAPYARATASPHVSPSSSSSSSRVSKSVESIVVQNSKAIREITEQYTSQVIPMDIDPISALETRSDTREVTLKRLKDMLEDVSTAASSVGL